MESRGQGARISRNVNVVKKKKQKFQGSIGLDLTVWKGDLRVELCPILSRKCPYEPRHSRDRRMIHNGSSGRHWALTSLIIGCVWRPSCLRPAEGCWHPVARQHGILLMTQPGSSQGGESWPPRPPLQHWQPCRVKNRLGGWWMGPGCVWYSVCLLASQVHWPEYPTGSLYLCLFSCYFPWECRGIPPPHHLLCSGRKHTTRFHTETHSHTRLYIKWARHPAMYFYAVCHVQNSKCWMAMTHFDGDFYICLSRNIFDISQVLW